MEWPCLTLAIKWLWLALDRLLLCTNGLRKQSSSLVGPPFLAMKFFLLSTRAIFSQEPSLQKLVNEWVW